MCAFTDALITMDAGFAKERQQHLNQEEGSLHIDRKSAVERRLVPLPDGFEVGDAGVDEQDIEPPEFPAKRLGDSLLGRGVARIGRDGQHTASQFLHCVFQRRRVFSGDGDTRAFRRKQPRGFQADAGAPPGNQRALSLESVHSQFLRFSLF